jgi:hypothetical protein
VKLVKFDAILFLIQDPLKLLDFHLAVVIQVPLKLLDFRLPRPS